VKNKIYLLLMLLVFSVKSQLQAQMRLSGQLGGCNADSISLSYMLNGKTHNNRIPVKNGIFTVTAPIDTPVMATLKLPFQGQSFDYPFFAERGALKLRGSVDNLDSIMNLSITGAPTQNMFNSYIKARMSLIKQADSLDALMANGSADSTVVKPQLFKIGQMISSGLAEQYIRNNPKNYVSLHLLSLLIGSRIDYDRANALFQGIDKSLRASSAGIPVKKSLSVLQLSATGKPLKAFSIPDMDGKMVTLADYKGKIILVDFWASWCVPCRQENPNLLENYNKYHAKGFDILGISCDTDAAKWKKAVNEDNLPWKQVKDWEILKYYGLQSIPSNFLLDGNGNILAINLRGEELTQKLDQIFSKK